MSKVEMVKVIPELELVVSQEILTITEEPLAVCCSEDYLFISTQNCAIEVYELNSLRQVNKFRTILPAISVLYNAKGDCLVTLEAKNVNSPSTARVYFNWRLATIETPVRVRLATPKEQKFNGDQTPKAETVELNITYAKSVSCISCCPETGLVALAAASTVSIYTLSETTEIGFTNIEPFLDITFSFPIEKLAIYVSYIACASKHEAFVVRYLLQGGKKKRWNSALYIKEKFSSLERKSKQPNYDRDFILWSPVNSWKPEECTNVTPLPTTSQEQYLVPKEEVTCLLHGSAIETVLLDSVCREFNMRSVNQRPVEVLGPVEFIRGEPVNFMIHKKDNEQVECRVVALLFRRFAKVSFASPPHRRPRRPRSSTLSELPERTAKETTPFNALHSILLAPCGRLAARGLCCYIANTHYCYIYNLLPRAHLTTSIAFTTPSISLQLDADLIHVLSTQSVDTYTSRHGAVATPSPWREQTSCEESGGEFWLCQPCPSPKQDSTLVSSSKLIGSTTIAVGSNNIVVLTKEVYQPDNRWFMQSLRLSSFHTTSSSWNVYILRRKTSTALSQQFVQLATQFSDFSHPYYYHLLCEAHLLLRSHLMAKPGDSDAATVLREICALLADYCSTQKDEEDHQLSADYYFVSKLSIGEVCDKFNDQKKNPNALLCYLNHLLYDTTQQYLLSKDMGDFIINFYSKHAPNLLPEILVHSPFLRQYSLGRTLELVQAAHDSKSNHSDDDKQKGATTKADSNTRLLDNKFLLCEAYLQQLMVKQSEALAVMSNISQKFLVTWVTSHHSLVMEGSKLTHMGQLLMKSNWKILLTAIVEYTSEGDVEFSDVCTVLKAEKLGEDADVLSLVFLEKLISCKAADLASQLLINAQLLLAEMYLERMKQNLSGEVKVQRDIPSELSQCGKRHQWLDQLPPFDTGKSTQDVPSVVADELKLLQTLLCFSTLHKEVAVFIDNYLSKNSGVFTSVLLSVQVLCWPQMDKLDEVIDTLLANCPQVIIDFSVTILGQRLVQWKVLLRKLLDLVSQQSEDKESVTIYPHLYKRALLFVVEITSPDEFFQLLPSQGSLAFFLPVIERCCQLYAAEQLGDEIRTAILS